ncbi:MAG: hypothetical protein RMA76_27025 [Deltaproteobacteria bacterium]|jgi:hypothetical protein
MQSSLEVASQLPHPLPLFDSEEETAVPPLALGYTNPPAMDDLGHASFFDVSARPLPVPVAVPEDDVLLDAAVGQHKRQVAVTALAVGGLALGAAAALLV